MADDSPSTTMAVARFNEPRLPYHPAIEERFGVTRAAWKALVEAVYPAAKTVDAVILVLSYCQGRKLDPFKRPVHIVPVWDSNAGKMVDTVWPGISETRTTAMRTKLYAGCDETAFGPDVEEEFIWDDKAKKTHSVTLTYPEWARCTVYRLVSGVKVPIVGPKVYWKETYATLSRFDTAPNEMWRKRPRGQIEKCAEAAALRRAFPEELGDEPTADEMEGAVIHGAPLLMPERALDEAFGKQRKAAPDSDTAPKEEPKKDPPKGKATPSMETKTASEPSPKASPEGAGPNGDGGGAAEETPSTDKPAENIVDFPGDRKASAVEQSNAAIIERQKGIAPSSTDDETNSGANPNVGEVINTETGEIAEVNIEEFNDFATEVRDRTDWAGLKALTSAFRRTPTMAGAPLDLQQKAMLLAYNHATQNGFEIPDLDVEWYRLWLCTITEESRHLVRPRFRQIMRGDEFQAMYGTPDADVVVDETNRASGDA
jgi:phage recombination protein Bet